MLDITGQRFGRLTAQWPAGIGKRRQQCWLTLCDCGQLRVVRRGNLTSGHTTSCGCWKREPASVTMKAIFTIHGHTKNGVATPTYASWQSAKSRCFNSNDKDFEKYGRAGVTMCDRWCDSFEAFLADMGERPPGTTLGRFLDMRNYEPGNVAWMTWVDQRAEQKKKQALLKAAKQAA